MMHMAVILILLQKYYLLPTEYSTFGLLIGLSVPLI